MVPITLTFLVTREHPDEEAAHERYIRLRDADQPTGWAGYCTNTTYCTRACAECWHMGTLADKCTDPDDLGIEGGDTNG